MQANARLSFSELGRAVGLSPNAAAARVRRLETDGIIVGYTALTAPGTPGRTGLEVYIDVRLRHEVDGDDFTDRVAAIAEVVEAVHMTGAFDYLLHAFVRDTAALDRLLRTLKSDGGVAQTQTRIAMRRRAAP